MGGYLAYCTANRACSALSICGIITACAPMSSAFFIKLGSSPAMRTIGIEPDCRINGGNSSIDSEP